jgi:hypothetical protein
MMSSHLLNARGELPEKAYAFSGSSSALFGLNWTR